MGFVLEDLAKQQVRYPLVWDPAFGPCPWPGEAAPEAIPALYFAPFAWTGQMEREFWQGTMREWADTHLAQLVVDWDFAPTRAADAAGERVARTWAGYESLPTGIQKAVIHTISEAIKTNFLPPAKPSGAGAPTPGGSPRRAKPKAGSSPR